METLEALEHSLRIITAKDVLMFRATINDDCHPPTADLIIQIGWHLTAWVESTAERMPFFRNCVRWKMEVPKDTWDLVSEIEGKTSPEHYEVPLWSLMAWAMRANLSPRRDLDPRKTKLGSAFDRLAVLSAMQIVATFEDPSSNVVIHEFGDDAGLTTSPYDEATKSRVGVPMIRFQTKNISIGLAGLRLPSPCTRDDPMPF